LLAKAHYILYCLGPHDILWLQDSKIAIHHPLKSLISSLNLESREDCATNGGMKPDNTFALTIISYKPLICSSQRWSVSWLPLHGQFILCYLWSWRYNLCKRVIGCCCWEVWRLYLLHSPHIVYEEEKNFGLAPIKLTTQFPNPSIGSSTPPIMAQPIIGVSNILVA
jgi:hypothetical protein